MKIGIIGTGRMGSTLGTLWATTRKHQIFYGSRQRIKADSLAAITGPEAFSGIYEEAAEFGEAVVIALPWLAVERHVTRIAPFLSGKILIDITNPLTPTMDGIAIDGNTSGAEIMQSYAPDAIVVKAFNAVYFESLGNPKFGDITAEVYTCGDDAAAKARVHALIEDLGFIPSDLGSLANARYLEAMTYIWVKRMIDGHIEGKNTIINIISRPER